jgi:RHS repeat-associated protein
MDDRDRIAMIDRETGGDTVIRYQLADHLGSSSIELDDKANIISYEEYHPFGTTSYQKHNTNISQKRYKYNGKERDNETGMYYYGARYYAAWTCRFVSVDPMKEERIWLTPYNYVQNNPVNRVDPTGMVDEGLSDDKVSVPEKPAKYIKNEKDFQEKQDNLRIDNDKYQYVYANSGKKFVRPECQISYTIKFNYKFVDPEYPWSRIKIEPTDGEASNYSFDFNESPGFIIKIEYPVLANSLGVSREVINKEFVYKGETLEGLYDKSNWKDLEVPSYLEVALKGFITGFETGAMHAVTSTPEKINIFGLRDGYGVFGKKGLSIGNYKVEALYASKGAGGTLFSVKQMKKSGALWRLDFGPLHGSGKMGLHSTVRFYFGGIKYGSTAQRIWYPSMLKAPFFKPLKK